MFENQSLTTRIAIGKGIGFLFGLAGFLLLPLFLPDAGWLLRWGILLWYTTVGAIIGVFGVYTRHPILKLPLPWWIRAPSRLPIAQKSRTWSEPWLRIDACVDCLQSDIRVMVQ